MSAESDEKVGGEDKAPANPPERYCILVSKGTEVVVSTVADAFSLATANFQTGNIGGLCKGNSAGDPEKDIKTILGMGQAIVELSSNMAKKIAAANGLVMIPAESAGPLVDAAGNEFVFPRRTPGMDN